MYFGSYLLALATVAAVLSAVGYFFVAREQKAYALAAKWFYYLMTLLVWAAIGYLVYLFLNDRFEYSYVSGYSSSDLYTNYKITSLWAGQEGSFLLWAGLGVLLGLWVKAKAKEQPGWVMFFYMIGQLFLFTLMNISSPFALNPVTPVDGRGLNPLLQNFWMQIHPPIIFLGYASTFVLFAFAMAALAAKRYDSWVKYAFPWAIFSVCALGAGIFLGGYWAYETLGWGGYWSWDPVENASLVPWMGSIALVHGMLIERSRGAFKKTNLFLAITAFLMVIYGTFLTRSGVLADFSVHSFIDLGMNIYLVLFLIGFTLLSYGLLVIRGKSIKSNESDKSPLSREFSVYLGMLFIILSAFLVLMGMSSPLLTRIVGDPSAVDISFYVKTNLPIGIILGLILGMSALVAWKPLIMKDFLRRLPVPIAISIIIAVIANFQGVDNFSHLIFIFTGVFALTANLTRYVVNIKSKGIFFFGSDLIHTGFAMMLLGVVISSGYSSHAKTTLEQGIPQDIQGFKITFTGVERLSENREEVHLNIESGSDTYHANPLFIWSQQGLVRNPYIKKFIFYDLYISPEELKERALSDSDRTVTLTRGQIAQIEGCEMKFIEFDAGSHMEGSALSIGAVVEVKLPDGDTLKIEPRYKISGDNRVELEPAFIQGLNKNAFLLKLNADEGMVLLGITDKANPDGFSPKNALIVEVTRKPFINLVWLGLVLIILGSGFSAYRRIKEIKN